MLAFQHAWRGLNLGSGTQTGLRMPGNLTVDLVVLQCHAGALAQMSGKQSFR